MAYDLTGIFRASPKDFGRNTLLYVISDCNAQFTDIDGNAIDYKDVLRLYDSDDMTDYNALDSVNVYYVSRYLVKGFPRTTKAAKAQYTRRANAWFTRYGVDDFPELVSVISFSVYMTEKPIAVDL